MPIARTSASEVAPTSRNRLSRGYAGDRLDRALGADDRPPLIDQRLIQPPAQHLHRQQAFWRDPTDHAAEFVHVGVHHDARPGGALRRDDRAEAVEGDRRRERPHLIDHHLADWLLESRRARRVCEQPQQFHGPVLRGDGAAAGEKRKCQGHDARGHRDLQ
jgi:hypothetical protein